MPDGELPPDIVFIDIICQRYKWTWDECVEQCERHPRLLGELLILLQSEQQAQQSVKSSKQYRDVERDQRRKRLGVI